jgi:hypothetical protein
MRLHDFAGEAVPLHERRSWQWLLVRLGLRIQMQILENIVVLVGF